MTDTPTDVATRKPSVLFVCIHNADRSQMAAGWTRHLAGDRVHVRSAGSEPAERINPMAVQAMDGCGDSDGEQCAEPCGRVPPSPTRIARSTRSRSANMRAFCGSHLVQLAALLRRHGVRLWLPETDGPIALAPSPTPWSAWWLPAVGVVLLAIS